MLPLRNLLRRKVRTVFAVLQIAVAIAAFVSIVGVTKGLRAQFYRISEVFAFDIVVQPSGAASPLFASVSEEEAAQVLGVDGVEAVSLMGIYVTLAEGRPQPLTMLALAPGSELLSRYEVSAGRSLRPGDDFQVIVGRLMAEEMGLEVGSTLAVGYDGDQSFEVVGIFEPPIEGIPFLEGQAIMSLEHYTGYYKLTPKVLAAHTAPGERASDPDEVRAALERCESIAPRIEAALPRMKARTIEDFLDSLKQSELVDSFALAISFLAALVSGIGVANTMLMSVFDRTREIGLLRAVGWSRRRIVSMIEAEGLILSLAGGLAGIPVGLVLIALAQEVIGLGWLQVTLDGPLYAQAVLFAALIGVVGSVYPAVRAAWLQPTEALRYE